MGALKKLAIKYMPEPLLLLLQYHYRRSIRPKMFRVPAAGFPSHLNYAFTLKCIAACPHCYLLQEDPDVFRKERQYADREQLERIFKANWVKSISSMSCGGGEALLHPEFFALLDIPRAAGVEHIQVVTNGLSLLREGVVEGLIANAHKVQNLHISLDAVDEDSYKRMKGVKKCDFSALLANIKLLSHDSRFRTSTNVGVSFVVGKENIAEGATMIDLASKLGMDYCHLTVLHLTNEANDAGLHSAQTLPMELRQVLNATTYDLDIIIQPPAVPANMHYYCESLDTHLSVSPSGIVAPCCHLPWTAECGNIDDKRDNPLNNPVALRMRQQFIDAQNLRDPTALPGQCQFCNRRLRGSYKFLRSAGRWIEPQ